MKEETLLPTGAELTVGKRAYSAPKAEVYLIPMQSMLEHFSLSGDVVDYENGGDLGETEDW